MGSFELLNPAIYKKLKQLSFDIDNLSDHLKSNSGPPVITQPLVYGNASGTPGSTVVLYADYSKSSASNYLVNYRWVLPNGDEYLGTKLEFKIPETASSGDKFTIKVTAIDTKSNESVPTYVDVYCKSETDPDIVFNDYAVTDYEGKTRDQIEVFFYWTCTREKTYYYDVEFQFSEIPDEIDLITNDPFLIHKVLSNTKIRIAYIQPTEIRNIPMIIKVRKGNSLHYIKFDKIVFASGYGVVVDLGEDLLPYHYFRITSDNFFVYVGDYNTIRQVDFKRKTTTNVRLPYEDYVCHLCPTYKVFADITTYNYNCGNYHWIRCINYNSKFYGTIKLFNDQTFYVYETDKINQDLVTSGSRWLPSSNNVWSSTHRFNFAQAYTKILRSNKTCSDGCSTSSFGIETFQTFTIQLYFPYNETLRKCVSVKSPTNYRQFKSDIRVSYDGSLVCGTFEKKDYSSKPEFIVYDAKKNVAYSWEGESLPHIDRLSTLLIVKHVSIPNDVVFVDDGMYLKRINDTTYGVFKFGSNIFDLCDESIEKCLLYNIIIDKNDNILARFHFPIADRVAMLNTKVFGCYIVIGNERWMWITPDIITTTTTLTFTYENKYRSPSTPEHKTFVFIKQTDTTEKISEEELLKTFSTDSATEFDKKPEIQTLNLHAKQSKSLSFDSGHSFNAWFSLFPE